MTYTLVAIKKDDVYYIRSKENYPSDFASEKHLRFNVSRLESFDAKWLVFGSLPASAERFVAGRSILTGFELKEGFQVTEQTPESLPVDTFKCCDDDCDNPEIRGLYDAIYDKLPDVWEPVELDIELIDADCAPLTKVKYAYTATFPNYIDRHAIVRHKYPCHIKAEKAFEYIRDAIRENLPPHCYISSNFVFHIQVEVRIPLLHKETHVVDSSGWNARKPKWKEVPLRDVTKTVINICTPNHSYGQVITDVHADNYADLERKMDGILKSYIDMMQIKPVMCSACKGHGWTVEAKQ